MKHLDYLFCLVVLFSIFMVSCEKEETKPEPISSFTISKTSAIVNESITFTNTSQNAISFLWDFGDGNTSTSENPSHAYLNVGTFTVTLKALGDGGEKTSSKTITVAYPIPVASFTIDKTTAKTGEIITFTNTSQNAKTYSWDFGDGSASTLESPTHSYLTDGAFTVTLTATGDGGVNSSSKSIEITKPLLIGKWIIESCKYNETLISGITGWINFINEKDYSSRFEKGDDYGQATAIYNIENGNEFNTNIPENIILFGSSFGFNSEGDWNTGILCIADNFLKFGATAILHTDYYGNVKFNITDNKLVLKSPDSKTEITYIKE